MILQNPHLQFTFDHKKTSWSLHSTQKDAPYLDGVQMRLHYQIPKPWHKLKRQTITALKTMRKLRFSGPEIVSSPHGNLQQLTLIPAPERCGLQITLTFALAEEHPLFLWKINLENTGEEPVWIERIDMLRAGFFPQKSFLPEPGPITLRKNIIPDEQGVIRPHPSLGELAFFSNGWQSWSHAGSYGAKDTYRQTKLGFFTSPMGYNTGTPRPKKKGYFASDMFGIIGDRQHRSGILAGFLSQKEHFGSLKVRIDDPLYPAMYMWANGDNARLDPGASLSTDWAAVQFVEIDAPNPLEVYLNAVARENHGARENHLTPDSPLFVGEGLGVRSEERSGWCSWYHYYQDFAAEDIRSNLEKAQEIRTNIPLDIIQIDDGYQAEIGDWLTFAPTFPDGVKPLADEIKQAGFTPGIWLSPFIVHPKSKLARTHPKWLLRNRWGLPVNAGFVWNVFTRALDLTHPPALEYAQKVIRTAVEDWGFSYLKLDFLYAAALSGRYSDPTKTRAQVLRQGMEAIRDAAGDGTTLLGCGSPLGSAIGLVEAMRIGADVHSSWHPAHGGLKHTIRTEPTMPSVRNAIQNILTRAMLHRRWWENDPDCLLLRPETDLRLDEVRSLATAIAFSGGIIMLSDDLTQLPPERLEIAQALLPPMGLRPRVVDWFDAPMPSIMRLDLENETGKWHLLAVFNWSRRKKNLNLELEGLGLDAEQSFYAHSFWGGDVSHVSGGMLNLDAIPAHGVRALALRPVKNVLQDSPQYVGSDLHISQGLEVVSWAATDSTLRATLSRPGQVRGRVVLSLPRPPRRASISQKEIPWQKAEGNLYSFDVEFHNQGELGVWV